MTLQERLAQAEPIICAAAARACRRGPIGCQDADDLAQEVRVRLCKAYCRYDARKGPWLGFATRVADNTITDRARAARCQKRGGGHTTVGGLDDSWPLTCTRGVRNAGADADVCAALSCMPPAWRDLANALKHESLAQVSRRMGVPRSTLNDRVRQIRSYLIAKGIVPDFFRHSRNGSRN